MGISVRLEAFEGPLDLLLNLIEKNKVNIYDIPIVEITAQYMEYVNAMQSKDLNVVSDFLVMAATLLDIKSKMLLPKEVNEEGEEEDPRAELVERLLEYKLYKYMSLELKDKQIDAARVLFKSSSLPEELKNCYAPIDMDQYLGDITLNKLNNIFKDIMRRSVNKYDEVRKDFGKIEKDEVSLEEKLDFVMEYAGTHKEFSFRQLLMEQCSKMQIIVTFLAILELMKMGKIVIVQEKIFDDIKICAA